MPEIVISEVYTSGIDQKINGRVYMAGEIVPDAHAIPTFAALIQTKRLHQHSTATPMLEPEEKAEDLGIAEARPPRAERKKTVKRVRKRTKKAKKGATAVK